MGSCRPSPADHGPTLPLKSLKNSSPQRGYCPACGLHAHTDMRRVALLVLTAFACGTPAEDDEPIPQAPSWAAGGRADTVDLGPPLPGDWLASFPEPKQNFEQYLETQPTTARGERRAIYVLPLGEFTPARRKIVDLTADFMGRYFGLPVVTRPDRPLTNVPADRHRPGPFGDQVLAGHVLTSVLRPELPDDAAAYIALTSADLYPEPERFLPERWVSLRPSPYAYHPFGAGPRLCIGAPLATAIIRVALERILSRYRLKVVPGSDIGVHVESTMLFPTNAVPMEIHAADGQYSSSPIVGNIRELVDLTDVPSIAHFTPQKPR